MKKNNVVIKIIARYTIELFGINSEIKFDITLIRNASNIDEKIKIIKLLL